MSDKCTVSEGRFVNGCRSLLQATEYGNPSGKKKGIFSWAYFSKGGGPTRTMFGTKSGEHTKGILFNYCPFCGTKIDAPFVDQKSTGDSAAEQKEPG